MQYCNNLNRYVLQKKQEIPDAGLQEWEEENEVTPVARQVAEQVMHASEAESICGTPAAKSIDKIKNINKIA